MEKKDKKLPVKYLMVDDNNPESGLTTISFVEDPAIQLDFIAYSKEQKLKKFKFKMSDKSERIVTGPVAVVDQPIYRIDPKTKEEYYAVIDKDNVKKLAKTFAQNLSKGTSIVNMNHQTPMEGVYLLEFWLTGENDKSKDFGYDIPQGSIMASFFVKNDDVWNNFIKTGDLVGFSLEALMYISETKPVVEHNFTAEEEKIIEKMVDFAIENDLI